MASVFRFKQFEVDQGNCAMRINTDGVLLGGWVSSADATRILDIGTGTGVIALMLAQRYPTAYIDAVELDEEACRQAAQNFNNSPFANQLSIIGGSFVDMDPTAGYDLIVSNPPFYTRSLHNPDPRKRLAKHTDDTFFEKLLAFVSLHLTEKGQFVCIVPTALADDLADKVLMLHGLFLQQELSISSFPQETPIRKLLHIGREKREIQREAMCIYEEKGVYSQRYKAILQPYFLAF